MAYESVRALDLEPTLGRPLTPAELAQADVWIGYTYRLIAAKFRGLDALDHDLTSFVVTEAVALRLRNPDGASQVDVTVDDARVSRRYPTSGGGITILPEWWDLLTPASEASGAAFTIVPG